MDFEIENETKMAMINRRDLLQNISAERIFVEWKKLLSGKRALEILEEFYSVVSVFFPEVKITEHINRSAFDSASLLAKHVSLFASAGAKSYAEAMHRMKTDRATLDSGKSAISALGKYENNSADLAFLLRDLGKETAKLALECEMILGISDVSKMELLSKIEASDVPYKLSMLNIDGSDLLALGFSGASIGVTLAKLQEMVILGSIENEKTALLEKAKILKNS